jgi:hypothetical protein
MEHNEMIDQIQSLGTKLCLTDTQIKTLLTPMKKATLSVAKDSSAEVKKYLLWLIENRTDERRFEKGKDLFPHLSNEDRNKGNMILTMFEPMNLVIFSSPNVMQRTTLGSFDEERNKMYTFLFHWVKHIEMK